MSPTLQEPPISVQDQTAKRYGYLWAHSEVQEPVVSYHYRQLKALLPEGHLCGLVLDAGCGLGLDAQHMAQDSPSCEVVALELSREGITSTRQRACEQDNLHVVQGTVEALPFPEETFDFVYSYGVLHHLSQPRRGFEELVRILKPRGLLAIYVYENFETRSALEQFLLRVVGLIRRLTVRCPPHWLYRVCQLAAPLVFVVFTLPSRLLANVAFTRLLSQRVPFRHATTPRGLVGDLYDRFAAPLEYRYSQAEVRYWFEEAHLETVCVIPHRGWLAYGRKGRRC